MEGIPHTCSLGKYDANLCLHYMINLKFLQAFLNILQISVKKNFITSKNTIYRTKNLIVLYYVLNDVFVYL